MNNLEIRSIHVDTTDDSIAHFQIWEFDGRIRTKVHVGAIKVESLMRFVHETRNE